MKYSAILWDLDGTLLNSLADIRQATNHALATEGLPLRSLEQVRHDVGNGVRQLIERSAPGAAPDVIDRLLVTFRTYYVAHCNDNTRPYDGVAEALKALKQRGVRMAVVSNKMQSGVTELHQRWFADTIDVAIGERPGVPRKPAPDMVQQALDALDVAPHEALYVGDSEVDVATARNAGLDCLGVLWGYRDRDVLVEAGATHLATTAAELLEWLG